MTDETPDELELLLQQSIALNEQAKLINTKIEELRKQKEREAPVIVRVLRLSGKYVMAKNEPYREDVVEEMKKIEGRSWRSHDKENAIPVGSWVDLKAALEKLPHLTVTYEESAESDIHDYLFAPAFSCSLTERYFIIKPSKNAFTHDLRQIPGSDFDYNKSYWKIPLGEGWRLLDFANRQPEGSFVWSEDAQELVLKQVEQRLRLDSIAKMEDVPDFVVPGLFGVTPRNFQKVGVEFFTVNGGSGILADEMGTGKTLQMIMLHLRKNWHGLIVCPAGLKANWVREIAKFTKEEVYTLQGVTPTPYDIAHIIKQRPRFVIINYDIIGRNIDLKTETKDVDGFVHSKAETRYPWIEVLNLCNFDAVVLDEAHYIKNVDSQRSRGARLLKIPNIICMTGTPVLNRPGELWPMLNMVAPSIFPSLENFTRQYTWDDKTARNVEELRTLLKPLMIRRLKKDVIKELPMCNRVNDYYELSDKARKLYERVEAGIYEVLAMWNPDAAGAQQQITNMLVQIMRMKQVCAIDAVEGTTDLATRIFDSTDIESKERPKKVLIFSQFKPTTYAITQRLGQEAIGFVRREGSIFTTDDAHNQQQKIDQFQNDPSIHFLCVTERTAKEGHNITAAMAVIFNDLFWTPAAHQQAEGRAYGRIGDLHPIDSYYRVGINSISEWIQELLAAKLKMIEEVVEGVEASRNGDTSIVKELLDRMKSGMWTKSNKK